MTLFFDCETTGLPMYGQRSEHPDQPHLVEIAGILVDKDWSVVESFHAIVRPFGWTIPMSVQGIHGITNQMATKVGIPEEEALAGFIAMAQRATSRLAYNEPFDARIIRIACKRYAPELVEWWSGQPSTCVMRLTQGFMRGPVQTLGAAYRAVLGKAPADTHTAMGDARACMELFRALARKTAPLSRPTKATKPTAPTSSFYAQT